MYYVIDLGIKLGSKGGLSFYRVDFISLLKREMKFYLYMIKLYCTDIIILSYMLWRNYVE